jgi:hypothetical protein
VTNTLAVLVSLAINDVPNNRDASLAAIVLLTGIGTLATYLYEASQERKQKRRLQQFVPLVVRQVLIEKYDDWKRRSNNIQYSLVVMKNNVDKTAWIPLTGNTSKKVLLNVQDGRFERGSVWFATLEKACESTYEPLNAFRHVLSLDLQKALEDYKTVVTVPIFDYNEVEKLDNLDSVCVIYVSADYNELEIADVNALQDLKNRLTQARFFYEGR